MRVHSPGRSRGSHHVSRRRDVLGGGRRRPGGSVRRRGSGPAYRCRGPLAQGSWMTAVRARAKQAKRRRSILFWGEAANVVAAEDGRDGGSRQAASAGVGGSFEEFPWVDKNSRRDILQDGTHRGNLAGAHVLSRRQRRRVGVGTPGELAGGSTNTTCGAHSPAFSTHLRRIVPGEGGKSAVAMAFPGAGLLRAPATSPLSWLARRCRPSPSYEM